MSEITVSFRELRDTDHSRHYDGTVSRPSGIIPLRKEVPHETQLSTYYHLTGWAGTMKAMALPRCRTAKAGHEAIAVAHTSKRFNGALARNVAEIVDVVDATASGHSKHVIALSESGATAIKAARLFNSKIATLTVVAPAEVIQGDTPLTLMLRAVAMGLEELVDFIEHPFVTAQLTLSGLASAVRRPAAIASEAYELMTHTINNDLESMKAVADSPHTRLIICDQDALMTRRKLEAAATVLPFDEVVVYSAHNAGHLALVYDARLTDMIIGLNAAA